MQRMKLHTSGVKPSKLGSIQDRITRQYMLKETELEVSRSQFTMMMALTNPQFNDERGSKWAGNIKKCWKEYLSLLFNLEVQEETDEEKVLKEYYDQVVSKLRPVIRKDRKTGKLEVSGLDQMKH